MVPLRNYAESLGYIVQFILWYIKDKQYWMGLRRGGLLLHCHPLLVLEYQDSTRADCRKSQVMTHQRQTFFVFQESLFRYQSHQQTRILAWKLQVARTWTTFRFLQFVCHLYTTKWPNDQIANLQRMLVNGTALGQLLYKFEFILSETQRNHHTQSSYAKQSKP